MVELTREEFGQKLKELRNRSKLTQTEVADFLGFETNGMFQIVPICLCFNDIKRLDGVSSFHKIPNHVKLL